MDNYTTAETARKIKEKYLTQPAMNDDQNKYDTNQVTIKTKKFRNKNMKK